MKRGGLLARLVLAASAASCIISLVLASAFGEPVEASRAAVVANGWHELRFRDAQDVLALPKAGFIEGDARPLVVKGVTVAYAFDVPGGGCIAIVADDELSPVLYYSFDSRLDVPAVPPAQAILEAFADGISEVQDSRYEKTGPPDPLWGFLEELADSPDGVSPIAPVPTGVVGPLLTTTWSQDEPYHDKCPVVEGDHCPVGCTATSMAQIMRYWKHPETGTGSHSYLWAFGGRTLSADFGSTTYDWANMPDAATPSSPQAVKDAVSTLSYHCGVAVDMDYGPYGSAAYLIGESLTDYFGYLPTSYVDKWDYTDEGWYRLMRDQLDRGWPVWYGIIIPAGGHAVVADGYDSANKSLHLNMGWGGQEDGFWSLQKYPPVDAVIDIRPDRPAISRDPFSLSSSCSEGKNAPDQTFQVWNSGAATLEYSITPEASWLSCSPSTGTSTGEHDTITVTYATSSLPLGSYSTNIRIDPVGATINPQSVRVNLKVMEPAPAIALSTPAISASGVQGSNAASQTYQVWNSAEKTLSYSISDNATWLSCIPISGTSTGEKDTITVNFATSGLSLGTYTATIVINATGATNTPQKVTVTLTVREPGPAICLNTESITASCVQGGNAPTQSFEIWNCGEKTLNYSIGDNASWLSCNPATGSSTGEHDTITLTFTTSALALGTYPATIVIGATGASNTPQRVPVTLTVNPPPPPAISLNVASLRNSCQAGGSAAAQSFEVWNSGGKTLNYSISDDVSWLGCTPTTGASTGEHDSISVSYTTGTLAAGIYLAKITISGTGASNSPQTMPVCLTVIGTSGPAIRHVDGAVAASGDGTSWAKAFKTIQQAIDAAADGDTVIVAQGIYVENVRVKGKNIVLRSTNPLDPAIVADTVIDGNRTDPVVTFHGSEKEDCVLSGFTIRNGRGERGGGICGRESGSALVTHAVVENNRIIGNSTPWHGGGIAWCYGAIRNNIVAGNVADQLGGGLWGCGGTIHNNTIVANSADTGGGASSCEGPITNCIVWGNSAPTGSQLYDSLTPIYSCIQDWTEGGEGNINSDPGFVDPDGGDDAPLTYFDNDYHLAADSPCVDSGTNEGWMWRGTDLDGNNRIFYGSRSATVDMGAYEFGSVPFRVVGISNVVGGQTNLTWCSRPGDTYVIWSCTDLLRGQWTTVTTIPSQGATTSWKEAAPSGRLLLYRIEMK